MRNVARDGSRLINSSFQKVHVTDIDYLVGLLTTNNVQGDTKKTGTFEKPNKN